MRSAIASKLLSNGVRNLNEFGYDGCTEANIITDPVYSELFASMLRDTKGVSGDIDAAIDSLMTEIEDAKE